jgi:hypothetical protein
MEEMAFVAEASPPLAGIALMRANQALSQLARPSPDVMQKLREEFDALIA